MRSFTLFAFVMAAATFSSARSGYRRQNGEGRGGRARLSSTSRSTDDISTDGCGQGSEDSSTESSPYQQPSGNVTDNPAANSTQPPQASTTAISAASNSSSNGTGDGLRDIQTSVQVGTAVTADMLKESTYANLVKTQWNMLTPGNEMKWDATESTEGTFTFSSADSIVSFAEENNMAIRGHTLVWYSQTPSWLASLDAPSLIDAMNNHIEKVMGQYKGEIYAWDVLNEVFSDNGDGSWRDSFWYKTLGEEFPTLALQTARKADPDAKLYINDYSTDGINSKSDALFELCKNLTSADLLDGVGFQAHLQVGQVPSDMEANLQRFADLGLDVAITELDIRMKTPGTAADIEQQTKDYGTVTKICASMPACKSFTVWGVTDADSWVPDFFSGEGQALIFDKDDKPKEAFTAVKEAL